MEKTRNLTEGNILGSLLRFALPVLLALFLQALYGGVDLLVVGQFATTADVSGVATGSMLMQTITMIITGLAIGITVLVGHRIGERLPAAEAGRAIGGGICLFAMFAVVLTASCGEGGAAILARMAAAPLPKPLHKPLCISRICGAGSIFIVAYNVLGAVSPWHWRF